MLRQSGVLLEFPFVWFYSILFPALFLNSTFSPLDFPRFCASLPSLFLSPLLLLCPWAASVAAREGHRNELSALMKFKSSSHCSEQRGSWVVSAPPLSPGTQTLLTSASKLAAINCWVARPGEARDRQLPPINSSSAFSCLSSGAPPSSPPLKGIGRVRLFCLHRISRSFIFCSYN